MAQLQMLSFYKDNQAPYDFVNEMGFELVALQTPFMCFVFPPYISLFQGPYKLERGLQTF